MAMALNIDKEMSKKRSFSDLMLGKPISSLCWDLCMFYLSSEKEKLECPGTFQHAAFVAGNIENYVSP